MDSVPTSSRALKLSILATIVVCTSLIEPARALFIQRCATDDVSFSDLFSPRELAGFTELHLSGMTQEQCLALSSQGVMRQSLARIFGHTPAGLLLREQQGRPRRRASLTMERCMACRQANGDAESDKSWHGSVVFHVQTALRGQLGVPVPARQLAVEMQHVLPSAVAAILDTDADYQFSPLLEEAVAPTSATVAVEEGKEVNPPAGCSGRSSPTGGLSDDEDQADGSGCGDREEKKREAVDEAVVEEEKPSSSTTVAGKEEREMSAADAAQAGPRAIQRRSSSDNLASSGLLFPEEARAAAAAQQRHGGQMPVHSIVVVVSCLAAVAAVLVVAVAVHAAKRSSKDKTQSSGSMPV